jgi:transcription elongation factor/antiterminator RfaH
LNSEPKAAWYAIRTKPKQEARVECNLKAWRLETFAPWLKEARRNQTNSSPSYSIKPLFPQYIFARFELQSMYQKVRFTRGVHSLVSFGDGPAIVEAEVISIIQSRIGKDGFIHLNDDLKADDNVLITDGHFKSICGLFERQISDSDRVMILLKTLHYQAHVIVERSLVRKLEARAFAP